MKKIIKIFTSFTFLFFTVSISAKTSDKDYKAKILANAYLGDQSFEELLSDNENESESDFLIHSIKSDERDVRFTPEILNFINRYFNNEIKDEEQLKKLFSTAVSAGNNSFTDEYSRLVNLARCNYFYGMWLMSTFDISDIDHLDLTDSNSSAALNHYAGQFYDQAIEFAQKALSIRQGSDAYATLAHIISANCTAKNTSYILANALKVRSYGKKALRLEPYNGAACFLYSAQDVYAPTPFCKLNRGRKAMQKYLNDPNIRKEKFDNFNISCAIAFSWYKKKKYTKALEWYRKSQNIYPDNYSVNMMINKINHKIK